MHERLQQMLRERAWRASELQRNFLSARQEALQQLAALVQLQMTAHQTASAAPRQSVPARPAWFDLVHLQEFATGSLAKCLGPEFEIYAGRRAPRIPNGDLLLMSRVVEIAGVRNQLDRPASIAVEYDVSPEAWFFRDGVTPRLPYSAWMEIALQPCGFLSAYLGTPLLYPSEDLYFRNLDGQGRILADLDVRGQIITTRARLLSTYNSGGTILQKFAFELSAAGQPLYEGESVFGYFKPEAMANQLGLDGGRPVLPLYERDAAGRQGTWIDLRSPDGRRFFQGNLDQPNARLAGGRLNLLDRVFVSEQGGDHGQGYLYALKRIDPQEWFFACHFYQDPVMPGSLGVEAVLQAMQVYALKTGLNREFRSLRFGLPLEHWLVWKYRGQIIPAHKEMKLEVHLKGVERAAPQLILRGDASLWADQTRIYEIKDAAISLQEG